MVVGTTSFADVCLNCAPGTVQLLSCEEGQDTLRASSGTLEHVAITSYPVAMQRLLALQVTACVHGRVVRARG